MMPPPGGWASKGTPPWEAAMPASAAAAIIKVVGSATPDNLGHSNSDGAEPKEVNYDAFAE